MTIMPAWSIHHRVYRMFGLPVKVCRAVDKYVDFGGKVFLGFELKIHDLGRQTPSVLREVSRDVIAKYGVDGFKCFLVHHILDYTEALLKLNYSQEFIEKKITDRFSPYFVPEDVREVARSLLLRIIDNLSVIITIIREGLRRKNLESDMRRVGLSRLMGVINAVCRIALIKKGMFSKGLRVQRKYYLKLISRVRKRVYNEILVNITSDIIGYLDRKLSRNKLSFDELFELKKDPLLNDIICKIQKIAEEETNDMLSS